MQPLISILIPVYNVEQFLCRCLESVINQTYHNLEIILIDDGSTDESGKICDCYAAKDARIRVIHQSNAGIGYVRNRSIQTASGEMVMFVDSDDYIPSNAVQLLYDRMQNDGSDLAVGKYVDVYEDGTINEDASKWMHDCVYTSTQALELLGNDDHIPVGILAKLYKKTLFDGIVYPSLSCGEDLWVFPLLIAKCEKISAVEQSVYFYYQRSTSVMHIRNEHAKIGELEATLHLVQRLLEKDLDTVATKWYIFAVLRAYQIADRERAKELFCAYIDRRIGMKLMRDQNVKMRIKTLAMYEPVVDHTMSALKKIRNGQ